MTDQKILMEAIEQSGTTQMELAEKLGVARSTVSTNLRRDNMGLDIFVHYLNVMGYAVCVGKKEGGFFLPEWEVEPGNTTPRKNRAEKIAKK